MEKERPDAVDVVTDTRSHHDFAIKALEAGAHVAVEKPMGLTVRACHRMMEAAQRTGRVLSVSENYRRDPMNRLAKALLESGVLGEPRLAFIVGLMGSRYVRQLAGWHHMKLRGGNFLESGVHVADLLLYLMGVVVRVQAETDLWERVRYTTDRLRVGVMTRFYGHRVKEEADQGESIDTTAEDVALAVFRFGSGALGQFSWGISALGQSTEASVVYCEEGSLTLSPVRSGQPVVVARYAGPSPIELIQGEEVLALVPDFHLDETTAPFFDGRQRLPSYALSFEEIDRKLVAVEMQDFGEAAISGRAPEVGGRPGLDAVALCYAILESGHAGKSISFADIVEDRINAYQREINESVGL